MTLEFCVPCYDHTERYSNGRCMACARRQNKKYYEKNREKISAQRKSVYDSDKSVSRVLSLTEQNKQKLLLMFGNRCDSCKETLPYCCYDFHHMDPAQKEHNVSALITRAWKYVEQEARKCTMLCSNCHRILHSLEVSS